MNFYVFVLGGYDNEPTCGRPLGMRLDSDGYLIVCDAYLGLYKVNVATGSLSPQCMCCTICKLTFRTSCAKL